MKDSLTGMCCVRVVCWHVLPARVLQDKERREQCTCSLSEYDRKPQWLSTTTAGVSLLHGLGKSKIECGCDPPCCCVSKVQSHMGHPRMNAHACIMMPSRTRARACACTVVLGVLWVGHVLSRAPILPALPFSFFSVPRHNTNSTCVCVCVCLDEQSVPVCVGGVDVIGLARGPWATTFSPGQPEPRPQKPRAQRAPASSCPPAST